MFTFFDQYWLSDVCSTTLTISYVIIGNILLFQTFACQL